MAKLHKNDKTYKLRTFVLKIKIKVIILNNRSLFHFVNKPDFQIDEMLEIIQDKLLTDLDDIKLILNTIPNFKERLKNMNQRLSLMQDEFINQARSQEKILLFLKEKAAINS